jgi:hypothetical protein
MAAKSQGHEECILPGIFVGSAQYVLKGCSMRNNGLKGGIGSAEPGYGPEAEGGVVVGGVNKGGR